MRSENILLIDHDNEPLKILLEKAGIQAGLRLLFVDSANNLDKNRSDYFSGILLNLNSYSQPKQGEDVLIDLKANFPDIPIIVLTKSEDNTKAEIRCINNGSYDFIEESALDMSQLCNALSIVLHKLKKKQDKQRLHKNQKINAPAIQHCKEDVSCKFAYKLNSVAMQMDANLLNSLIRASIQWNHYLLNVIIQSYSEYVVASLIMNKKVDKKEIEFYLVFTLTDSNGQELMALTDEFIASVESFIFSIHELHTKPYVFGAVEDPEVLADLVSPKISNPTIRMYTPSECWGSIRDYNFEVADASEILNSEFLPVPSKGKYYTNLNLLSQSLLSTSGNSVLAMHVQPLQLRYNEKQFITRIIEDGEITPANKIEESLDSHIALFKEILSTPKNNYLFEVRFLSDAHPHIPRPLDVELARHFYSDRSIVQHTYQKGLFDNLFSVAANKKLSRLSFFKTGKEVADLFCLPAPENKPVKGIPYQNSSMQVIPANRSKEGLLLGKKLLGGKNLKIRIDTESLKKHMYILGQTGTGKTTLLKTMIQDAISTNKGFCVIDPHGDLFEDVMKMIPVHRQPEVVFFDTNNMLDSAKLNFLTSDVSVQKSTLFDEIIRILDVEYDMRLTGGPIFETYFKATLNLVSHPRIVKKFKTPTIQLAYKALLIPKFLKYLLEIVNTDEFDSKNDIDYSSEKISDAESDYLFKVALSTTGDWQWDNMRPYVYSKMKFFVDNNYIRELFDNKSPDLNFRDIMDNGKILLVRLEKGHIGTANLGKVGRLFLNKMIFSIMSRAELPIEQRRDFFIFIDEFQNFVDGDIGSALSEVRKYNVGLILANQTIGQLTDRVFQSVMGNVGSTAFFRVGINDIGIIKHFFEPDFTPKEIINLPNFNCVARIMHKNKPSEPFIFQTKRMK